MGQIHALAVVDAKATLGKNVTIGPFCVVGGDVILGDGVVLHSHVVVTGHTQIGAGTQIWPFASIGTQPQDLKYRGEESRLVIGERCMIREHVTMNPGTAGDRMETIVGDDCLFMMGSHVAHDCVVGNHVILANNATLAGHVTVGNHAIIGGLSAIRQFVRIGAHAMIGGMTGVEADVIPFGTVVGERGHLAGLNLIGLERRGFNRDVIAQLRKLFDLVFSDNGTLAERLEQGEKEYGQHEAAAQILAFIQAKAKGQALTQPKHAVKKAA